MEAPSLCTDGVTMVTGAASEAPVPPGLATSRAAYGTVADMDVTDVVGQSVSITGSVGTDTGAMVVAVAATALLSANSFRSLAISSSRSADRLHGARRGGLQCEHEFVIRMVAEYSSSTVHIPSFSSSLETLDDLAVKP